LREGELTRADDSYYLPNDPALHKARGRKAFNGTAESSAIKGARYLEYDGADDLFITAVGTTYRQATAALPTGTFSDLVTGLTGSDTLDSVHYNNNHYLLNGVDRNRQVDSSAAVTLHGMLANTAAPTTTTPGSGNITLSADKTITYWIEERVKSGSTILRRNAATSDEVSTITGLLSSVTPTFVHTVVNTTDTTHVALFATATDGTFPTGAEITEVAVSTPTTTITDDRATVTDPGIPSGALYEVFSVSIGGDANNIARNGPPPIAKTADVFEDSLVMDDSTDASLIRYSWQDEPHKFPALNFIRFETREADEVRMIRTLGQAIIVGLRDSLWRVDFLPRPEDAEFDRGRVKTQITAAHGPVGPLAGAVLNFGAGPRLAYISRYGILLTDGYSWDVLTDDIAWETTVNVSQLGNAVLINNPRFYRLEFYYPSINSTVNDSCFYLHYHPSHIKEGIGGNRRSKVTGPINVKARSALLANIGGRHEVFTGHADGVLYQENEGNSDTSASGGIKFLCRTGDLYLAGIGGHMHVTKTWVHHPIAPDATQEITGKLVQRNEGEEDVEVSATYALTRREPTHAQKQGQAEAIQLSAENSDTKGSIQVNYFVVEGRSLGESEES
jgi:hypothetical protein